MLLPQPMGSGRQRRLVGVFSQLSRADQDTLLAFAEFLHARREPDGIPAGPSRLAEPKPIPRPDKESVVAAIRRLSATFFMLDKEHLLHQASALMSAHIMHGRSADEVIAELEAMFRHEYERIKAQHESQDTAPCE